MRLLLVGNFELERYCKNWAVNNTQHDSLTLLNIVSRIAAGEQPVTSTIIIISESVVTKMRSLPCRKVDVESEVAGDWTGFSEKAYASWEICSRAKAALARIVYVRALVAVSPFRAVALCELVAVRALARTRLLLVAPAATLQGRTIHSFRVCWAAL
jgi:hypothetical protein